MACGVEEGAEPHLAFAAHRRPDWKALHSRSQI
jgi:hypothetical protein